MFDPKTDIDWTRLVPIDNAHWESEDQERDVRGLAAQAAAYLQRFEWCSGIGDGSGVVSSGRWYGDGIADKIGVFLFEARIDPRWQGLDTWTWLIVGDLPPARISPWYARNPYQALNSYAGEMARWVEAVRAGESIEGIIPVNVAPTLEYADLLRRRVDLIRQMLVEPEKPLLKAPVAGDRETPPRSSGPTA